MKTINLGGNIYNANYTTQSGGSNSKLGSYGNGYKDGHHLNSSYWKDLKKNITEMPAGMMEMLVGVMLGDANMYRTKVGDAKIKMEQGLLHKAYIEHLFKEMSLFVFQNSLRVRYILDGPEEGEIKSFELKTFTHPVFNPLWDLFYDSNGKRRIINGLVKNHLTPKGLAYWIMDDGSLKKSTNAMTLNTHGFTRNEVDMLSAELNQKFGLHSTVSMTKKGRKEYPVIYIPAGDAGTLINLVSKYIAYGMEYKIPISK